MRKSNVHTKMNNYVCNKLTEKADAGCSWCNVCIKSTERLFGCMNDSWIENTFYMTKSHYSEGHTELNKCCSFCLSSTIIMALVPPSSPSVPMLLQSSVMCECVFPDVRGLVTHCPILFCFLNLLLCLQVRASDFKP